MIVAPEWSTLKDISRGIDSPDPVKHKQAVEHTLMMIADALPDVEAVRIFQREEQNLIVYAATDLTTKAIYPLSQAQSFQTLIAEKTIRWSADTKQWIAPLMANDTIYGVFEVLVEDLDEDWLTWLEAVTHQIAPKLALFMANEDMHTQDMNVLLRQAMRLSQANRVIVTTEEYDEVANAVIFATGDAVSAAIITTFAQPLNLTETSGEGMTNNQRFVRAIATQQTSELIATDISASSMPSIDFIQELLRESPVIIAPITESQEYVSDWVHNRAQQHDAKQLASFGLVGGGQLVGTLDLLLPEVRQLTTEEIDFYTTLANQVGTTILSKRQLQRSREAQQFASQLVKTNKTLAIADSYQEMAEAVLRDTPKTIEAVAIALFNRPFERMGVPVSLNTHVVISRDKQLEANFSDPVSAADNARVTYFLNEFLEGNLRQLWNSEKARPPVMAHHLVEILTEETHVSFVSAFGLNMQGSLRGLLVLGSTEDFIEGTPQYNSLRALADQLSAVIENNILLDQTSTALELIQNQYDTTSRVFKASQLSDILSALMDFAGPSFERGHLVWRGADGVVRLVARADEQGLHDVNEVVSIADYPASQTLSVLEALEVRNIREDAFITDDERKSLAADNIGAFVILPIVENLVVNGLVMLMSKKPTRVEPARLRALRSLSNQVSVVLQNRNLLRASELNLQEIRVLYEVNRNMLRTQSSMDVLHVLAEHLAPDASAICQMGITYHPHNRNQITQVSLDYELTASDGNVLHEALPAKPEELENIYKFLRQVNTSVMFSPKGATVFNNPVQLIMSRYTMASYVAIVMKRQGQVNTLIVLFFDEEKPFPDGVRQLYEAIADQVAIALENQNLLRETQISASRLSRQVSALQSISDLAVKINQTQSEKKLLDISVQALVDSLNIDHSSVVLFNLNDGMGRVVSEYPGTRFLGQDVPIDDNPLLAPGFDLNDVVNVEDVATDTTLSEGLRELLLGGGIRSIILVPLLGQRGELIGSVGLDVYNQPRRFDIAEIQTAQTISAQMAVGLQNVRLLRDAQQRAEQLQHISDFSAITQSTLELQDLIESALSNIPRLLTVSHMTVDLYDTQREALVMMGGWQENNSFRTRLESGGEVPMKGTTVGYVFENGHHLYLSNMKAQKGLYYPHSRTITSLLSVPVANQGRVLGVVTVASYEVNAYTETDIAIFQQLVNQMAVAIDNAQTYTESQRVAKNKTLANEIAVKLQRESKVEQMINLTMNELGRAIGAKRGRVRLKTTDTPTGNPNESEQ